MVDGDTWFPGLPEGDPASDDAVDHGNRNLRDDPVVDEYVFALFFTSTGAPHHAARDCGLIRLVPASPGMFWDAAVALITAPLILFVLIVQRQLISGLSQGTLRK